MARTGLKFMNGLISALVTVALLVTALYAGFALWDNHQIYHAAESVFDEMKSIKAKMAAQAKADEEARIAAQKAAEEAARLAEEEAAAQAAAEARAALESTFTSYGAPFEELKAINPDVNGWVTMPGTAIDYPLVQGETNFSYINTDVYGNFALSGSIFLDSRNDNYYTDPYSLLYGHNMSNHRMFGDVNLYKDETFFKEHTTGELYLSDRLHHLTTLSCIVTNASDTLIFNPETWKKLDVNEYAESARANAVHVNEDGMTALQTLIGSGGQPRILALSTCSDEFTEARTIVLTLID